MQSVNILSRQDIREIVKEFVDKEVDFLRKELSNLRTGLYDLERMFAIKFGNI